MVESRPVGCGWFCLACCWVSLSFSPASDCISSSSMMVGMASVLVEKKSDPCLSGSVVAVQIMPWKNPFLQHNPGN